MKAKNCSTCLWWWDLYDTGERKCYKRESKFFHEPTDAENTCADHERINRKDLHLGFYRKCKKEACSGES